jgi:ABC-type Fe3+/spermidine/putrescine transport system ATPase subunit
LELADNLYKSEKNATTKEWISAAKIFEAYVVGDGTQAAIKGEPKQSTKQTKKDEPKPSTEHIKGINTMMAIVESRGGEGKEIINNMIEENNYKSVKDFTEEDMEEATKELEDLGTSEVPF